MKLLRTGTRLPACIGKHCRTSLCLLSITLLGCSGAAVTPPPGDRLHALMVADLARYQARLDSLFFDQHRTETELATLRQQNAEAIRDAALSLQQRAGQLPALAPASLDPTLRQQFEVLAGTLGAEAGLVAIQVERGNLDALGNAMQRINRTCDSCHALYRTP